MDNPIFIFDTQTLNLISNNLGLVSTVVTILGTLILSVIAFKRMKTEVKKADLEYAKIATSMQTEILEPLHKHIMNLNTRIKTIESNLDEEMKLRRTCENSLSKLYLQISLLEEKLRINNTLSETASLIDSK